MTYLGVRVDDLRIVSGSVLPDQESFAALGMAASTLPRVLERRDLRDWENVLQTH